MTQQAAHGKVKFQAATNALMWCQTLLVLHALLLSSSSQAQECKGTETSEAATKLRYHVSLS